MKTKKTMAPLLAACAVGLALGGCDAPRLEVRTFPVESMRAYEVETLITPYVYSDREENPGMLTVGDGYVTVRETPDNLDRIERILGEYDQGRSDVRLHFQLIEADGFTAADEAIAEVETELRKIFQFRGYRLAAEGVVAATDQSTIQQVMRGPDDLYELSGQVVWTGPSTLRLDGLALYAQRGETHLTTTVNLRPGQTLVLGSSPKAGSNATLLLTVRAEEVRPDV